MPPSPPLTCWYCPAVLTHGNTHHVWTGRFRRMACTACFIAQQQRRRAAVTRLREYDAPKPDLRVVERARKG